MEGLLAKGSLFAGAGYLFRGFTLINKKGIRHYVLIPLAINISVFSSIIWFGATQFNQFMDFLLPTWLDWLEWLLWPLFAVAILVIVFYAFILFCNLISAPFNGLLSEAVEVFLTGTPGPSEGGVKAMIMNVWPAFASEGKKIIYFLPRAILLLLLFIIPGINILAPVVWLIFSAWMLALEYADYPMGNHGLLFKEQRSKLREKRWMVLGFGGAALVLLMIPFVNFIAMPTAVAGATVMWVEELRGD